MIVEFTTADQTLGLEFPFRVCDSMGSGVWCVLLRDLNAVNGLLSTNCWSGIE